MKFSLSIFVFWNGKEESATNSTVISCVSVHVNVMLAWNKEKIIRSKCCLGFMNWWLTRILKCTVLSGPQKRDLPGTKNVQEIVIEHHVIKIEARERDRREISKTRNVLMKVLMADQKTQGAQRSVKQGRYNWLYIHPISSFLWSCILWFSLQLFKGTPVSSLRYWSN